MFMVKLFPYYAEEYMCVSVIRNTAVYCLTARNFALYHSILELLFFKESLQSQASAMAMAF